MATSLQSMATSIADRSKTLINNDLKRICKEEGVAQTGNKAALQTRVVSLIQNAVSKNDAEALRRLQYRVQNRGEAPLFNSSSPAAPSIPHYSTPPTNGYSMPNGQAAPVSYPPVYQQHQAPPRPPCLFKDSPFFEIRECLLSNITLEASPSHRQNCSKTLILNEQVCARLKSDPTLRVLLFSALEQPLTRDTPIDIAFPSQIEVRLNGEEVKANYKGLKNKPGSTRPADITHLVRTSPANHRNTLVVTYALTQKKYILFVYLVKKFSVEELTMQITRRNVITKQSVLNEMMEKANDPDIEVGSIVMSLKDPISTLRINTPCRSTMCTHNQCFDAESFLQLQEQAPTWTCPICSNTVSYKDLAVDQYVEEILNKIKNLDQVIIKPTGEWTTQSENLSPTKKGNGAHYDSDDDLVEIQDYRIRAIKTETAPTPTSLGTPPLPSRETSTAPRSSTKRPIEVVDLISDDDEPPVKKVAYSTPSSLPDPSRRYQLPLPHASAHSRPLPPSYHSTLPGTASTYPQSPSTPPNRNNTYEPSYRPPPPLSSRPSYPGQGTSTYPTYLGSSP